jgi:hypothetical protein
MSIEIAARTNSMAYAEDFRRINEDWISANFWLEESDILHFHFRNIILKFIGVR